MWPEFAIYRIVYKPAVYYYAQLMFKRVLNDNHTNFTTQKWESYSK